ncbi:MAG TPA: methyl-accepting chemotaxis protein [Polyangiaceae bacterium]|nr:methyl-accepting chemotaxis protein [Polyangiaceae bacterium]
MSTSEVYNSIAIVLAASLIVVGIYQRFGKGLATRIFGQIVPIIAMTALLARFGARNAPTSIENLATYPIVVVVCVFVIFRVYRGVVVGLVEKTTGMQASTAQLASTARETAATAAQQATMVAEASTTLQEIEATSAASADSAKAVMDDTAEALRVCRQGRDAVAEAQRIMELIAQVASIVDAVSELAEKSNLLAVNASIEAAKAGELGRGFAVVAAEVRNLAEQSKVATRQIHDAIRRTAQGQQAVATASEVINQLARVLDATTDKAKEIAAATRQQASGVQQISGAIVSVSQGAQEVATAGRQIEEAVGALDKLSLGVRNWVIGVSAAR